MKIKDIINALLGRKKLLQLEAPKEEKKPTPPTKEERIEHIIEKMPENLTQMEKAYYVYLELGKELCESQEFIYSTREEKVRDYNQRVDDRFEGICKSMAELYVDILTDPRVGIEAETVMKYPGAELSHVDTIMKINGKTYIANIIADLSRIKSHEKTKKFGYEVDPEGVRKAVRIDNELYKFNLEGQYGKIDTIPADELEKMDSKLGYTLRTKGKNIYLSDTLIQLQKEMNDENLLKEYVFKREDVPESERLIYKLDYLADNMDGIIDKQGRINYLDMIRIYMQVAGTVLKPEEFARLKSYTIARNGNVHDLVSIIKVKPFAKEPNGQNTYYMYSNESQKFQKKSKKEITDIIQNDNNKIVGTADRNNPINKDDIEL